MKNFVHIGDNITIPAPATVTSGELVIAGSLFGIASTDALAGESVTLSTTGVFEMAKVAANDITLGAVVYYDASSDLVTTTASGNTKIGVAVEDAGNGVGTVRVRLNGAF
ncbi:MAG: DUF2190 family protein [Pseudomonadota bacterium]